MALKKILPKPGVVRENTRYTTEGGWYDGDKIRFRQGTPEKIGGWSRISGNTFLGICRSLWNWVALGSLNLTGVGTNLKFYIEKGGVYYDVTPLRSSVSLTDPFSTTIGVATVEVTDVAHGGITGDFVTFSGATAVGGLDLNAEYEITVVDADTYTIEASTTASGTATGGGTVGAAYQINIGAEIALPFSGWGSGPWGSGPWGSGTASTIAIRLWSQTNFGEDLVINPRGGQIYYWDASSGTSTRAVEISTLGGADTPVVCNFVFVSDVSRFVFAFGTNEVGGSTLDPLLVRWSDQEDISVWTPSALTQAASLPLSHGTEIVTAMQARQEILVWTDSALYSMQFVGAPDIWTANLVGDNISVASQNATAYAANVAYWMGKDKFYRYDGTVLPLSCDVRRYVFGDFNLDQYAQVFAGTNEGFHEVWWFYCSADSDTVDRYVVYNYLENLWYYGTMGRTAWLDSGIKNYPLAATYSNNLVYQEFGNDCNETGTTMPIRAYISSSEFDLDDGHTFAFCWRVLPDITFSGSDNPTPTATLYLEPLLNSGSGVISPESVGGNSSGAIVRGVAAPIETFTQQIDVRIRGRQLIMTMESTETGVAWQMGAMRLDLRTDGRR